MAKMTILAIFTKFADFKVIKMADILLLTSKYVNTICIRYCRGHLDQKMTHQYFCPNLPLVAHCVVNLREEDQANRQEAFLDYPLFDQTQRPV